jgi:hypothetical protein
MSEINIPIKLGEREMESTDSPLHELQSSRASGDPLLERFESLVEAVLLLPPPSVPCSHPQWAALFRWCGRHRKQLAARARDCIRNDSQERVDVWLRELASPPKGMWDGVRYGAMQYIRLVGHLPRNSGQPMFTAPPIRHSRMADD